MRLYYLSIQSPHILKASDITSSFRNDLKKFVRINCANHYGLQVDGQEMAKNVEKYLNGGGQFLHGPEGTKVSTPFARLKFL